MDPRIKTKAITQARFMDNFPEDYRKIRFPDTAGFGVKPVSKEGTYRLVRAAIRYALENQLIPQEE